MRARDRRGGWLAGRIDVAHEARAYSTRPRLPWWATRG